MGAVFWVVSGQSSCLCPYLAWLRALPGECVSIPQSRWIPAWRFLGGWQDILVVDSSFFSWPLPRLRTFFVYCVRLGNPLDHKNEKNVVELSSTQSLFCSCWSLISRCQQETSCSCSAWGPSSPTSVMIRQHSRTWRHLFIQGKLTGFLWFLVVPPTVRWISLRWSESQEALMKKRPWKFQLQSSQVFYSIFDICKW